MLIWHPHINCVRQRAPIRQPGLSKLMLGIEDKKSVLDPPVSIKQWSGRGLKQNPVDSPEETVGFN